MEEREESFAQHIANSNPNRSLEKLYKFSAMYRSAALFALGALGSPATAAWLKPAADSTLDAPVQTGHLGPDAGEDHQMAIGWSPVPTNAPRLAGAMDMRFALGKRADLSQTCGWGSIGSELTPFKPD